MRGFAASSLLAFAALSLPSAAAHDDILFASSVSYCEPPELVLVQQFDIVYFAANQSVFFNVSAASVESNVNVTANLLVNVYGMQPLNLTLDLCSILNGALCPLPTYNFTGSDILQLPDSIDVAQHVPGIAYSIPDLEAFAQLTLTRVDTGQVKACIQTTLSNGWSTRQKAVSWSTGGLALFTLLLAVFHTLLPSASASLSSLPFYLIDLLMLYQSIATSALLALNYPVVYRAFAANFAWALGLWSARDGGSKIQAAIDDLRHRTGGTMDDASGSGVELVNRALSPYNALQQLNAVRTRADVYSVSAKVFGNDGSNTTTIAKRADQLTQLMKRAGEETTLTVTSQNELQAGIPVWINSLGISEANAFLSVFFTLLILTAITLGVMALIWGTIFLLNRQRRRQQQQQLSSNNNSIIKSEKTAIDHDTAFDTDSHTSRLDALQTSFPRIARAWALRLALIAFLPIALFSLHQWTLKDSWLATLFSVLTLLALLIGVFAYPLYVIYKFKRSVISNTSVDSPDSGSGFDQGLATGPTSSRWPYALYAHPHILQTLGPLYARFRPERWYAGFAVGLFLSLFVRSLLVAFAGPSPLVQLILLLIVDLATVLFYFVPGIQPFAVPPKTEKKRGCCGCGIRGRRGTGEKEELESQQVNERRSIQVPAFAGKNQKWLLGFTLAGGRLALTILSFAFVQSFGVTAIPRVVVGFVALVVSSVMVLMYVGVIVSVSVRGIWGLLRGKDSGRGVGVWRLGSTASGSREGDLESGTATDEDADEKKLRERPVHPEPITPATATSVSSTAARTPTTASTDLDLGNVLPRRREFEGLPGLSGFNLDEIEDEDEESGRAVHAH